MNDDKSQSQPSALRGGGTMDYDGVPIGKLIDIRHECTVLIKANLYDYTAGNKHEGRAALMVRQKLDELILNTPPLEADAEAVRRGYLKATFCSDTAEVCDILDTYYARANGAKAAMACLAADKDALFRFSPRYQCEIEKIASGWEWLADRSFKKMHESIRRDAIPYIEPRQ